MHPNDRRNRGDLPFLAQFLIQSRRCSVQKYFRTTKRRALCSSKNWFQSIFSKLPLRSINQKFLRTETNSRWKSSRITSTLTDSGFILYFHRNSSNLKLLSQNDLVNLHKLCCCPRQSRGQCLGEELQVAKVLPGDFKVLPGDIKVLPLSIKGDSSRSHPKRFPSRNGQFCARDRCFIQRGSKWKHA